MGTNEAMFPSCMCQHTVVHLSSFQCRTFPKDYGHRGWRYCFEFPDSVLCHILVCLIWAPGGALSMEIGLRVWGWH